VVKNPDVHRAVLERVMAAAWDSGFLVKGAMASPIRGVEGNREYFLALQRSSVPHKQGEENINLDEIVRNAFKM